MKMTRRGFLRATLAVAASAVVPALALDVLAKESGFAIKRVATGLTPDMLSAHQYRVYVSDGELIKEVIPDKDFYLSADVRDQWLKSAQDTFNPETSWMIDGMVFPKNV